ncbi:MAG: type II toxin-antitoxin system PemK/MazF family toxin [Rickettsiales bacterium]|jgi:mRNA interferase MazF|nr:type II toxin-antitoxin system PemK/MazF family toxin [Rickettsiales bacterium]
MTQRYNFGEIWLADLNPRIGTESGKTRPVLILQNQVLLDIGHPSTVVLPLTTKLINDATPLRMRLNAQERLQKNSDVMIDQIRAIDNKRLIEGPLFKCSNEFLLQIKNALTEILNFDNIPDENLC